MLLCRAVGLYELGDLSKSVVQGWCGLVHIPLGLVFGA